MLVGPPLTNLQDASYNTVRQALSQAGGLKKERTMHKLLAERLRNIALDLTQRAYPEGPLADLEEAATCLETQAIIRTESLAEERLAWDRYAAGLCADSTIRKNEDIVRIANDLLEDRRKRFGAGK
jgi:hypothetical protein